MAARHDSMDSEEFVRLSLTDSTYAKVIFNDVKDFYLANEDVNCAFTMMSIEPMVGDKVALYKVGWSCADDYVIAQPCHAEKCHFPIDMSVTFAGSTLPKDDGEYYQFCYITANDEIKGGSTPFVFKNSPVEDLFSEEDIENDLLLIQTRTSILEGSLQKAIKEKTSIQIEKQSLEKDLDSQNATILNLKTITKDQDEKIRALELKLTDIKTDAATNESMLKEEISQLNHFINGMKVAIAALGREKVELEKTISELQLGKDALTDKCTGLHSVMNNFIDVQKTLHIKLKSKSETISSLQALSTSLEKDLSEKLCRIKNLEKEQQEQHLQYNEITAQLVDKDVMLAAMSASKSLAADELQNCSKKQAEIEAQNCSLREQCEKYKAQVDTLENDKIELDQQLKENLSKHAVTKKEVKFLLEKQTELQKTSSQLNLDIKDLQNRLALGGEEYRRKYIEWHTMQNKVVKLQKKLSLQTNKQDGRHAKNLRQSVDSVNAQGSTSKIQDLTAFSGYGQNDVRENPVPVSLVRCASFGANLNQDQSAKIHAAMESQLQKFHGTKGSSNSLTDVSVGDNGSTREAQSITSSTSQKSYPYPPFYPYPYPLSLITDGCESHSNNSGNIPNSSLVAPSPYAERRWLSADSTEDSFIMTPSPNTQVLAQENVLQANIDFQPLLELSSNIRSLEEETMDSSYSTITCPICHEHVPESSDINEHIDAHLYLKCPVCLNLFNRDKCDMLSFNRHVLDHLD